MNNESKRDRFKNPELNKPTKTNYSLHLDRMSLPVYDFENDDVISLNVDYSQDEKSGDDHQQHDEEDESKYELLKCKLSKSNNTSSQQDSGCDTFKFELNPQKYSLELSTLSSSSSSSSSSSFSSVSITTSLKDKEISSNSLNSNLSKLDSSLSYIVKFHQAKNNNNPQISNINNNKTQSSVFTKISSASCSSSVQSVKQAKKSYPFRKKINRNVSHIETSRLKSFPSTEVDCYRLKFCRSESTKLTPSPYEHKNNLKQQLQLYRLKKLTRDTLIDSKNKLKSNAYGILDLDDYLLVKIFSKLNTTEKLLLQFVCKRFFYLIWSSVHSYKLFKRIEIVHNENNAAIFQYFKNIHSTNILNKSSTLSKTRIAQFFKRKKDKIECTASSGNFQISINADLVLKFLFTKLLNRHTFPLCLCVEYIIIRDNHRLTDRGLDLISQFCPELSYLSIKSCLNIKTNAMTRLISSCVSSKVAPPMGRLNRAILCARNSTFI